ncbi:endonuclease/exonuclease/phosphatase family protein [Flaviaesturariibacter flavus]|uniref:endonuclease/exonuclease/phosphatase family protein n=1 Tax=Flaviaesturariibacter flavus TaxID=2502780 RepID=UPI001A9CD8CD|nr:endonuclease/exonuclease/phosphatase family protein [Flaviaesturariibacter flavus]
MDILYLALASLLLVTALLPLVPHPHWVFRIWEFGRIQALVLQLLTIVLGFVAAEHDTRFWILQGALCVLAGGNIVTLFPYTRLYRVPPPPSRKGRGDVSLLSVNVYQFNNEHHRLLDLVREKQPDILLTMESNKAWEDALAPLDADYPHSLKIPMENTYGMHFYSRLKVRRLQAHYFVSDDLPSIEAELEDPAGLRFTVFCVHPAPPSPTEEETARERDGELLSVAKKVKEHNGHALVVGDFNNVAWARSSVLFRKESGLIDPRIGRGFVSTFHAKYKFLRFPIDLFFHSPEVFVEEFCTLRPIGSDHLPLYCHFLYQPGRRAAGGAGGAAGGRRRSGSGRNDRRRQGGDQQP